MIEACNEKPRALLLDVKLKLADIRLDSSLATGVERDAYGRVSQALTHNLGVYTLP